MISPPFFFHLNPLFGGWWLIAAVPNRGILAPLPFHGCFPFLETYLSSKLDGCVTFREQSRKVVLVLTGIKLIFFVVAAIVLLFQS